MYIITYLELNLYILCSSLLFYKILSIYSNIYMIFTKKNREIVINIAVNNYN